MATPKRPEFPDWYRNERAVSPHIGPTQREMLTRRIKSLRKFLIGVSFVGVATFTALASQHGATNATTTNQSATTALSQGSGSTTSSASTSNTTGTASNSATLSSATSSQSTKSNTSSSQSASNLRTKTASS